MPGADGVGVAVSVWVTTVGGRVLPPGAVGVIVTVTVTRFCSDTVVVTAPTEGVLTSPETPLLAGALGVTVTIIVSPLGAVEVEGAGTTGVLTSPDTSLLAGALGVTVMMTVSPLGAVEVSGVGTALSSETAGCEALGVTVTMTVWPLGAVEVEGEGTSLADSPPTGTPGTDVAPSTPDEAGAEGEPGVWVAVTGQIVVPMDTTWVTTAWEVDPCSSVVSTVLMAVLKIVEVEENVVRTGVGAEVAPSTPDEAGAEVAPSTPDEAGAEGVPAG